MKRLISGYSALSPSALILAFGVGMGIAAFLVFLLGTFGEFNGWTNGALFIILSLLFLPAFVKDLRKEWRQQGGIRISQDARQTQVTLILSMLALGSGAFLWALSPSIRYDALTYHLAAPEAYLQAEKIIPILTNFQTVQAHYSQMVNTFALAIFGQPLPGLLHFSLGYLTMLMTYFTGSLLGGRRLGIVSAVLFYSIPMVNFESGTAYNDLYVAFDMICAVFALLKWREGGQRNWLLLAGIFSGLALGVKFNAITMILPLGLALGWFSIKRHGFSKRTLGDLFAFALPIALIYSPWAVRDWLWTKNPIFPLLENIFPSPINPLWSYQKQIIPPYPANFLVRVLRLPWDLTVNTSWYYHEGLDGGLGSIPMLALPWLYLIEPSLSLEQRKRYGFVFGFCAAVVVFSMNFSSRARYLMHLYPLLSILAAANLEAGWRAVTAWRWRKLTYWIMGVLALFYLFSTRLNVIVRGWEIPERFPYQVALGLETPSDYLSRTLRVYDAFQYLDRQGGYYKVLSLGVKFNLYTRSEIWGDPISGGDAVIAYEREMSTDDLAERLAARSFDYLLVDWLAVATDELDGLPILSDEFLRTYARLVFARNNISLYRLSAIPMSREVGESNNLLSNAGFETSPAESGEPEWAVFPENAGSVWSKEKPHSGSYTVVPDALTPIFQEAPVTPGQLYTLSHWTRADQADQTARLQINWLDEKRNFISAEIRVIAVHSEWTQSQFSITAPEKAAIAQVYVSVHGNSRVFFDDYCFAEGDVCVP